MTERTKAIVRLVAVVIVQIAALVGLDIELESLADVLGSLVVLVVTVATAWFNFNFTDAAVSGQKVTDSIKAACKGEDSDD